MYTGTYTTPLVHILYILQILHWYTGTHTADTYTSMNNLIVYLISYLKLINMFSLPLSHS